MHQRYRWQRALGVYERSVNTDLLANDADYKKCPLPTAAVSCDPPRANSEVLIFTATLQSLINRAVLPALPMACEQVELDRNKHNEHPEYEKLEPREFVDDE
mmetsp:Transcript_13116/g.23180  ORF Transcript_13116/g.23180 Transcript_13116/m.23180 type:complete len:102 (-) Transcript_13116:730-1035(-)